MYIGKVIELMNILCLYTSAHFSVKSKDDNFNNWRYDYV